MKYNPYNYQIYATEFIKQNKIAAILLDMGLGKSVISLTAINDLFNSSLIKKVLIIAPLRVARNTWPNEIRKWDHLSHLTYSLVVGTEKERLEALNSKAMIYIINTENVEWLVNRSYVHLNFDMLVIDELSKFKSYSAKRFRALLKIRHKFDRVIGLSGTPCSNGLMDLWAEYRLLDGGERLGKYITHFRDMYFLPDKRNKEIVFSYKLRDFAEEAIYNKISDITISMKAVDYLSLPKIIYNDVIVELNETERKLYDALKDEMIVEVKGQEIDAVNAGVLSNKLVQMANGAIYDENKEVVNIHDNKLDALEEIISNSGDKSILVAYWYKHDLAKIKSRFNCKEILTDNDINNWNKGLIKIGLIHPSSCSMGLNLQEGGSILCFYSLTWSLELYEQTIARLYRQGQMSNVVVHHIIAKDTIDAKIINALKGKEDIKVALINAVKAEVKV